MSRIKSVAEYAFISFLNNSGFDIREFEFEINGNIGILKDKIGNTLMLSYDKDSKSVYVMQ